MFTGLNLLSFRRPSAVTHTKYVDVGIAIKIFFLGKLKEKLARKARENTDASISDRAHAPWAINSIWPPYRQKGLWRTRLTRTIISSNYNMTSGFKPFITETDFRVRYLSVQCKDFIWFYWTMKNFYHCSCKFRSLSHLYAVMRVFYRLSVTLLVFDSYLSFSLYFQELRESEYIPIDGHASPSSRSKWVVFLLNSPVYKFKVNSLTPSCS